MHATLHQWKWDFRRIGVLWVCWLLVLGLTSLGANYAFLGGPSLRFLSPLLIILQSITIFLFSILLLMRLMYTTPFSGAEAFWKTRPLTRRALFWTKTTMIVALLWVPVVASQILSWSLSGANARFLLWGSLHFGALTLAILFLAAVWAAICQRPSSFVLCFVSSGAWAALSAISLTQVAQRSAFFPWTPESSAWIGNFEAVSVSTVILSMAILAAAGLLAWFVAGRNQSPRAAKAAVAILAIGITLSTTGGNLWRVGLFGGGDELPKRELTVRVLAAEESPEPGHQLLWNQLAVAPPPGHFALVRTASMRFSSKEGSQLASSSTDDQSSTSSRDHIAALAAYYPEEVTIIGPADQHWNRSSLIQRHLGAIGTLQGELELLLVKWVKVASLPLEPGARARRADAGLIGIATITSRSSDTVEVQVNSLIPPRAFRDNLLFERASHLNPGAAFVLTRPGSSRALVGSGRSSSTMGGMALSMDSQFRRVEFSRQLLTGPQGDLADLSGARLDVFIPVPVATATTPFKREEWVAYDSRDDESASPEASSPPFAGNELPPNPSPEQVEAYLDWVLFHTSESLPHDQLLIIRENLRTLGSQHLDRLVARLPVGQYISDMFYRVIREFANEDHREMIVEALSREPGLAPLVLERGWQREAAPILTRRLARHVPLEWRAAPSSVVIVASQADPSTYDDLRWHFVHALSGHRLMAPALAKCPGFPLDEVIAQTWKQARFEYAGRRFELAGLAARLGDKEALRMTLVKYVEDKRPEHLRPLAEAVAHPGGDDLLAEWIHANFNSLAYNPETRKFELP